MSNQSSTPKQVTKKHVARLERERRQTALIRWIVFGSIALVVGIIGYGYLDLNYLQLKKPVAEVNGEVITVKQWQERVQFQRTSLMNQYQQMVFYQQNFGFDTSQQQQGILLQLQNDQVIGQTVLDQLVDEALIRQQAKKLGITITKKEEEDALHAAFGFFPDGTPTPAATATAFEMPTMSSQQLTMYPHTATPTEFMTPTTAPTETPNPASTPTLAATPTKAIPTPTFIPTVEEPTATPYTLEVFNNTFATAVANYEAAGVSESTIREINEASLLRQKVLDVVTADTPHTEEQVWARHILVADEQTAVVVRTLLLEGKSFAEVAKQYSTDTGSAAVGGDLGWFGKGAMVPEFEAAAFSQKVGEIGEPVKSQFGYHIIQVLARADVPLSASQYQQKQQAEFNAWLEKIKSESAILIHDEWRNLVPPAPSAIPQ